MKRELPPNITKEELLDILDDELEKIKNIQVALKEALDIESTKERRRDYVIKNIYYISYNNKPDFMNPYTDKDAALGAINALKIMDSYIDGKDIIDITNYGIIECTVKNRLV